MHRNRLKALGAVIFAATFAIAVGAVAQEDGENGKPKGQDPAKKAALFEKENNADKVPLPALVTKAEEKLNEMQAVREAALSKLEEARKAKDALALQCVNEQVVTIKGMVKLGQKAKSGVERAASAGNESKARNEMRKLNAASAKALAAGVKARNCAGEDSVSVKTDVEVLVDESIGASDPYYGNNGQFNNPSNAIVDGSTGGNVGSDNGSVTPPPAPTTGFQ